MPQFIKDKLVKMGILKGGKGDKASDIMTVAGLKFKKKTSTSSDWIGGALY